MAKLQIGVELNTDRDPKDYEIRVTPVDVEVPDEVANAARIVQAFLDSNDANPGDGEADIPVKSKFPINFFFVRTSVSIDGNVFIRVKD
jgi:hypothetical protein